MKIFSIEPKMSSKIFSRLPQDVFCSIDFVILQVVMIPGTMIETKIVRKIKELTAYFLLCSDFVRTFGLAHKKSICVRPRNAFEAFYEVGNCLTNVMNSRAAKVI